MLHLNKLFCLFLMLSIYSLSSCTIYRTLEIDKGAEYLEKNKELGKTFIIHNDSEDFEYELTAVNMENDSLKGILIEAPFGRKHTAHKRNFKKSVVKAYEPRSVIHIYSSVKTNLNPGPFGIPISSIKSTEIHKVNKTASGLASAGIAYGAVFVIAIIEVLNNGIGIQPSWPY